MYNEIIDYTISSYDYKHYNRIDINLPSPPTRLSKIVVTSLTTNCNIVVIGKDDYIQINNKKYYFKDDYCDINRETFILLLNDVIGDSSVTSYIDNAGRIVFSSDNMFTINSCTYNILQLTGLYSQSTPLLSNYNESITKYELMAESIGNTLSTPILYLVSNIGKSSYRNYNDSINISKIILRINNSFSANHPIIVNNADFEVYVNSNDLSHLSLTMTDANLHEVHLLNPMYLTISVQGIIDDDLFTDINTDYDNGVAKGAASRYSEATRNAANK